MIVGSGNFCYEWVEDWGLAAKEKWSDIREIAGITVDCLDQVYLLTRVRPPVIKMSKSGEILDSFGGEVFVRPHGIYLDKDGSIYGVDDGGHAVYHFDKEKNLIQTLGERNKPSDTGCPLGGKYYQVQYGGPPFNRPTRLTIDRDGMIYITDGYGNARVHKFDRDGNLLKSWGEPGEGPGQFNLPHGIGIDSQGVLYVADRQNHRIQRFTTDGEFIDVWTGFHRPSDVWIDGNDTIFVAECKRTSEFDAYPSRVSILKRNGELLARLDQETMYSPEFGSRCAHGLAVDSEGSLYVAEVGKKLKEDFFGVRKYKRI